MINQAKGDDYAEGKDRSSGNRYCCMQMANVARMLLKQHSDVEVLMTQNATQFINPITFESLTGHKCLVDTFDRNFQYSVEHVALAAGDVALAPRFATAMHGKIANGIADDMLTTTVMACPCKKIVSPAMNHNMYHNPIVQDNIEKLKHFGYEIITRPRECWPTAISVTAECRRSPYCSKPW